MSKRAVIYTRVSTDEQAREGTSLEVQRTACLDFCRVRGYEVDRVFEEQGESAKTGKGTQFGQLLT